MKERWWAPKEQCDECGRLFASIGYCNLCGFDQTMKFRGPDIEKSQEPYRAYLVERCRQRADELVRLADKLERR